ncbi:prephenate dehydrogenase [Secundilactobacillus collinoides]|uniref:Prephenate dehydrogenase n=1 Tax=Secundilactobacillus collinoides DSM 20515 = JCM 1123 TaxID=1423733 RepID=A0A0R2BNX7_SECCO|nr:prephenate dehydrogenase/arogenate dehydrogenase family protein [Secundilactobacillus collinoides]KRM77510.1 prephenate dehydrogenase [Secundilactobacillus collinoides DSM 20515 = JCM 1123]
MTTVFISGLGLIGSSLARIMQQIDTDTTVLGADPNDDTSQFLLAQGVIDARTTFAEGSAKADVIILAGPVSVITKQLAALADLPLKPNVVVIDVGSTKRQVMAAAKPLQKKGIAFMGGHPMAGSHETGGRAGRVNLFDGAVYFLVDGSQRLEQRQLFQRLLAPAQLRWVTIEAEQHDQLVSQISHVPHVLAATLINTAVAELKNDPVGLKAAAGGFKSTTRIAASDPTMWTAIMLSNTEAITSQLDDYIATLTKIKTAIAAGDEPQIHDFFEQAQRTRQQLDRTTEEG